MRESHDKVRSLGAGQTRQFHPGKYSESASGTHRRTRRSLARPSLLVLAGLLVLCRVIEPAARPDEVGGDSIQRLQQALGSYQPPGFGVFPRRIPQAVKLAFEIRDPAIPILGRTLDESTQPSERHLAAWCLMVIGGKEAIQRLRQGYERTDDREVLTLYCGAIPTAVDDVGFGVLAATVAMPQPRYGGDSYAQVESAALSLGLLRSEPARQCLLRAVATRIDSTTSRAVRKALEWMGTQPGVAEGTGPVEQVENRALRFPVPEMDDSRAFIEGECCWRLLDQVWMRDCTNGTHCHGVSSLLGFDVFSGSGQGDALVLLSIRSPATGVETAYLYIFRESLGSSAPASVVRAYLAWR